MAVYFVTGGLGSGKGLAAMNQIKTYAANGVKIAGNLDVYLEYLCENINSKITYTRIPDRPTKFDLQALGSGNETYDNDLNSLLVLDELATWFNARTWNDKGRTDLLDWLVHSRKHGWDVILIVQSIETVDKQLVELLMEYHVPMSDLSKINVPIIGRLGRSLKKNNKPIKLPKIHIGTVLYKNMIKADRWVFRARDLYNAYDTKQIFTEKNDFGAHSQLSRWHLEGRYKKHTKHTNLILKIIFYYSVKIATKITDPKQLALPYKILSTNHKTCF